MLWGGGVCVGVCVPVFCFSVLSSECFFWFFSRFCRSSSISSIRGGMQPGISIFRVTTLSAPVDMENWKSCYVSSISFLHKQDSFKFPSLIKRFFKDYYQNNMWQIRNFIEKTVFSDLWRWCCAGQWSSWGPWGTWGACWAAACGSKSSEPPAEAPAAPPPSTAPPGPDGLFRKQKTNISLQPFRHELFSFKKRTFDSSIYFQSTKITSTFTCWFT